MRWGRLDIRCGPAGPLLFTGLALLIACSKPLPPYGLDSARASRPLHCPHGNTEKHWQPDRKRAAQPTAAEAVEAWREEIEAAFSAEHLTRRPHTNPPEYVLGLRDQLVLEMRVERSEHGYRVAYWGACSSASPELFIGRSVPPESQA